jgi:hypothetical protein
MTAHTRRILEIYYLRKSSQPIKLGASTALIINPSIDQSRNNHIGHTNDDDTNITSQASPTLKAHLKRDKQK